VHEDIILHHIRWNDNSAHWVDLDKIDKNSLFSPKNKKKESRYHCETLDELPLPWIKCPWCNYRHKKERDLQWHFLEEHRNKLYQNRWNHYKTETKLERQSNLAKTKMRKFG
jgi:hypothetical protein